MAQSAAPEPQTIPREPPADFVPDEEEGIGSLLVPERLAVWSWVLGYTALLSSLSVLRYHLWLATGWDLGFFQQGLWLLLHRGLLAVSTYTSHPVLTDATSYVLVILAPLYAVGGVGLLLVLQAFAFGLGYLFLRRIGRTIGVEDRCCHLIGVIYLIYPTVLGANLFDFHPDALGVPLLLALVWAALERRWWPYAILLPATLLVKDTVPVALLGMAVVLLWRRQALWGVLTGAVALGWVFLDVQVVIPHLAHVVMPQWSAYGQLGPTPIKGVEHLLADPVLLFAWVDRLRSWEYLAWLLGPFVGLAATLRARLVNAWWVPVLAVAEVNLLSPLPQLTSPFNQYTLFALPFLFTAVLAGGRGVPIPGRRRAALWLAVPLLLLAVFVWQQQRTNWRALPADPGALQAAVATIPSGAPVAAQNFVLPHVSDRSKVWQLAILASRALPAGTYVLLDPGTTTHAVPRGLMPRVEQALAKPGEASSVFSKAGVTVQWLLKPLGPFKAAG